jgi:hypothetical protein
MSENKKQNKLSVKERIVKISNEIRIGKDGKNSFQNYEYFKPDDIAKALNPLLERHELLIHFNMPYSKEKGMYEAKLTIVDIKSDDQVVYLFDIPLTELKGTGMAQNAGATMTYAKRYLQMNVFNLADNSADPDNEKNKPAEKVDYAYKLSGAKTLVELQKIWASVPPREKGELNVFKEELKAKLSK